MNNTSKQKRAALRRAHPELFKHLPRVRSGHAGKVACLTYSTHKRLGT